MRQKCNFDKHKHSQPVIKLYVRSLYITRSILACDWRKAQFTTGTLCWSSRKHPFMKEAVLVFSASSDNDSRVVTKVFRRQDKRWYQLSTQNYFHLTVSLMSVQHMSCATQQNRETSLVQVLLLMGLDNDVAGGVSYASQDESVLNLSVVQE